VDVGETLNNLGSLQLRRKQYARAEVTLTRALGVIEHAQGSGHLDVAIVSNNLGVVYHSQKKFSAAEQAFLRSLSIYRSSYSSEDRHIANCLFNLSAVLMDVGRPNEAEPLLKEAIAIRAARPHPVAEEDAAVYEKYAAALRMNGDSLGAETAESRARSMRRELQFTFRP